MRPPPGRYTYERIQGASGLNETHFRITDTRTDSRIATCHLEANAQTIVRLMNVGFDAEEMRRNMNDL